MAISGDRYDFTDKNISNAPTYKGVYVLYYVRETIYIGKAEGIGGIRARLQSHKRGDMGRCTQRATAYRRGSSTNPTAREIALLEEYYRSHGKLPRCNDRVG